MTFLSIVFTETFCNLRTWVSVVKEFECTGRDPSSNVQVSCPVAFTRIRPEHALKSVQCISLLSLPTRRYEQI